MIIALFIINFDFNKNDNKQCLQKTNKLPHKFLKRLAVRLFRFTICICLLVIIMIEAIFLYLAFDDAGYCLEHGGVWDGNKKLCRYD